MKSKSNESLSSASTTPAIDEEFLKTFYEDFGPDNDLISQLIERFFLSAPVRVQAVCSAIERADSKALRYEAHSLKNISMNIGGRRLSEIALQLEKLGDNGSFAGVEQLRDTLEAEYARLDEALRKKLETLKKN